MRVQVFVWHESAATATDTATVHRGVKKSGLFLQRRMHNHDLIQDGTSDLTVIRGVHIVPRHGSLNYPYVFERTDEVPETLSDLRVSEMYAWNTQAMVPMRDISGTLIHIDSLEDDADSPRL